MSATRLEHAGPPPVVEVPRGRAMRLPVAIGAGTAALMALIYFVDPNQPGHYPLCPFKAATGLDCPGCGATRGLHDLMHGDVVGALDHNVLLAVAVPVALLGWFAWVRRSWTGASRRFVTPRWVVYLTVAVLIVFWVVRNLPGVPFLASS